MRRNIAIAIGVIILGAVVSYYFSVAVALIVTFTFMVAFILGRRRRLEKKK